MFFNGIKGIVDKKLGLVFFPLCVCVLGRGIYNAIALLFAQLFCHLVVAEVSHQQLPVVLFLLFFPALRFQAQNKKRKKKAQVRRANYSHKSYL